MTFESQSQLTASKMIRPKTIFKYQSTDLQSILNFRRQALYMAPPRLFNDPYDCSLQFELEGLNDQQIIKLKKESSISNDPERFKRILSERSDEEIKSIYEILARQALQRSIENFLKSSGVCCFSEVNDDLLMWGHYSDSFKGFCLEFRTEYEPFTKLYKVNYSDDFPIINSYELLNGENSSFVENLFCTKSTKWRYEKEWRVLHKEAGTLYQYESECIKAIFFGPKIDPDLKEILCLILSGQNPEVELWEGKLSEKEFGIEFNPFKYTTYIDAKRNGQIT